MSYQVENIAEYQGHTGSLYALAADQQTARAFTSGDDGIVAEWQLDRPEVSGKGLLQVDSAVYALEWIEEWNWLAVGMSDGTLYLLDPASQKLVHTTRKITEPIYGLKYEEDRHYLWMLYGKGYVQILKLPAFEEVGFRKIADNHLRAIVFSKGESAVYFGASDQHILRMDSQSGDLSHTWKAHENSVFSLAMHPQKHYLISGGRDAHLNLWSAKAPFQNIRKIPAHNFTINAIAFSPDEKYVMTGSRDKTLKLWDTGSFNLLKVIDWKRNNGHKHSVNRLIWMNDGTILSAGDDRRLIRWRLHVRE